MIPADIAARISSDDEPGDAGSALQRRRARAVARAVDARIGARAGEPRLLPTDPAGRRRQAIDSLITGGKLGSLGAPSNLIGLRRNPARPCSASSPRSRRGRAHAAGTHRHVRRRSPPRTCRSQDGAVDDRAADPRSTRAGARAANAAGHVRRRRRREHLADVRVRAAGRRRRRCSSARRTRSRASSARRWSPARSCSPRRPARAPPARSCSRFAMLAGVGAFVTLDWSRVGLWLWPRSRRRRVRRARRRDRRPGPRGAGRHAARVPALAAARAARAGALRAPSSGGFLRVINAISFVFPFKACLQALDAAVNSASPPLAARCATWPA